MLAGISAGKGKNEVVILEKMSTCGKKLRITGKGRCNITNACDISEFINNIPGNGRFLYSSFQNFTNKDIIQILESEGLRTKVERGDRVFPITDNAQSVIDALYSKLRKLNVKVITNAEAKDIIVHEGIVKGVEYIYEGKKQIIEADKVIMATRRSELQSNWFKPEKDIKLQKHMVIL